jgi:hypothetical protein
MIELIASSVLTALAGMFAYSARRDRSFAEKARREANDSASASSQMASVSEQHMAAAAASADKAYEYRSEAARSALAAASWSKTVAANVDAAVAREVEKASGRITVKPPNDRARTNPLADLQARVDAEANTHEAAAKAAEIADSHRRNSGTVGVDHRMQSDPRIGRKMN